MRCLWLTWIDPQPEHDGQRIYSGRLIEAAAKAGAQIRVLCFSSGNSPRSDGEVEGRVRWSMVPYPSRPAWASVLSLLPHIAHRSATAPMRQAFDGLLQAGTWDAIVLDGLYAGWALRPYQRRFPNGRRPRLVYVSHNHEETLRRSLADNFDGPTAKRRMLQLDAGKVRALERRLVDSADVVTAITPQDAALFGRRRGGKPLVVLPPGYGGRRVRERRITAETPRSVVVAGSFEWIAKQMNLEEFLESADGHFAEAGVRLRVIGNGDEAFFARLRRRFRAVDVVGRVEAVTPYLNEARLAVVPERTGGGFKLKVLEYVFNRTPIAALDSSVAGTPLTPGVSMLMFPTQRDLAAGILQAVDDIPLLNRLQERAFAACADRFDWSERGMRLVGALAPP
jgi:polysaccharide biosynthesis protein PslH